MEIIKKSLGDQIYNVLKLEILEQKISFGEVLSNRYLQERFGVSSSPIRDAINKLHNDGLISNISRHGAVVMDLDYAVATEVNEILICITAYAVKLCSQKVSYKEITPELDYTIIYQEENIFNDDFFKYDYEFHKIFIDHSDNNRLKNLFKQYNVLHEVLVRKFYYTSDFTKRRWSIKEHKMIRDFFASGDIDGAVNQTELHYKKGSEWFKDFSNKKVSIDE